MTCTKHQPGILYYDICSPWKHRPLPLFGTYRYPVFIYILILTVSTSHRSIIFVDNIRHVYRNFLFLSIPSFWTKTIWCHSDCSIIFPNYSSLFLTLIGRIYNIKIPSVLLQNILLEMGTCFMRSTLKVPITGTFLREHWSISWNELIKLSTESSIGFKLPSESTGKPSMKSSTIQHQVQSWWYYLFCDQCYLLNSEVKKVSKW